MCVLYQMQPELCIYGLMAPGYNKGKWGLCEEQKGEKGKRAEGQHKNADKLI